MNYLDVKNIDMKANGTPTSGAAGPSLKDILLTGLAPAIWGSTYLVTSQWLPPGQPLLSGVIRALPAGLAMLAFGRQLPRGGWWWRAAVLGVLNIGFFQAMLFIAAYRLPGGVAATVGAIQPLIVVVLAWAWLGARPRPAAWMAGAGGLLGVALLVLGPAARLDAVGVAAAAAGAVSMAVGTVLTRHWQPPVSPLVLTAWQLCAGGLFLLPFALVLEPLPGHFTLANWLGYAWLSIVGAGFSYALWFRGVGRMPSAAVAALGLLSPVSATVLGFLVLGQALTAVQAAGALLVLGSVWLGQRAAAPATVARAQAA
ncbi:TRANSMEMBRANE PROTEIN, similar to pecM, Involved in pectinase, cellulase, and blue pigment regulation [Cupriavidus taiwanensis]|uniref:TRANSMEMBRANE PROTEIN, similar to pecM, Involved in pectinase, cellulase, and blue pigment regulation n=2 Tax=Cupriavidus taiwanensis TaxID=164546 RepID=A0A375ITR2_9BURK|nr:TRANSMEMBRANE PROTEIN, similar to pecM, Involved in pectinase, cellulase, and blue pigment regulation [Cupriavidus taiwanensis]